MTETGPAERGPAARRHVLDLFLLLLTGLFMASFFSPALPRLRPSLGGWTGVLSAALGIALLFRVYRAVRHARELRWRVAAFLAILLVQVATHVPFLLYPQASLNSDRAVTLLMVENILKGTSRPIYFYGQLYQGSLDAYVYALVALVARPEIAVLLGNLILIAIFVFFGILLLRDLSGSRAFLYPLVILSLPVGATLFLALDRVHGFALVAALLSVLLYAVSRASEGEGEGSSLAIGFVSGLLFWSYQPSLTWIASLFFWLAVSWIAKRRWSVLGHALWQAPIGLAVGGLPHILSEMNGGWINARRFLVPPEGVAAGHLGIGDLAAALIAVLRVDSGSIAGEGAWLVVAALSIVGIAVSLHHAIQRRDPKWIYLPAVFAISLGLLLASGYPPVPRYLVHYRLYGLFPVLLAGLACLESRYLARPRVKTAAVVIAGFVALGSSIGAARRLAAPDAEEHATVDSLGQADAGILLGDYWNTLRFAPFVDEGHLITAAPSVRYPNGIFATAKYYPLALELGARWDGASRGLVSRHSDRRRIERLLHELDVDFTSESLDGFVLYSDFDEPLSPELASLLIEGAEAEPEIRRGRHRAITERFAALAPITIDGREVRTPAMGEGPPLDDSLRSGWQVVLERDDARLRLAADPAVSHHYLLPPDLGLDGGTYQARLYYLGMPVHDYGPHELGDVPGGLVFSRIQDETTFRNAEVGEDGPSGHSGGAGVGVRGLPLQDIRISVRDERIETLELYVYSFFDFGSSIWTHRYEQMLTVEGQEFPLAYRENIVRVAVRGGTSLRLDTRYKSLLGARDSLGSPVFHNVGAVLERVVCRTGDGSYEVYPFLRQSAER